MPCTPSCLGQNFSTLQVSAYAHAVMYWQPLWHSRVSQLVLSWHVSESSPGVLSYLLTFCSVLMVFPMLVACLNSRWALP